METFWRILATLALVGLNGFFVAAEFAAVSARASHLQAASSTDLLSRLGLKIKRQLDLYLSSCQLGITIASLGLGAVTEPAVAVLVDPILELIGVPAHRMHAVSLTIALAISTSLHVVVGEVAPKNWAIAYPDRLIRFIAPPLVLFTYIFYPAIWGLNSASNMLLRWSGVRLHGGEGAIPHTEEELRGLLAQAIAQGTIAKGHERILAAAFEFGQLKVRQIMTPRTQVDYLLLDQPMRDVLRTVQKSAFTRFPLCEKDVDHVVGLVHMKDLFTHLNLVPGKLRFIDEKSPEGEVVAIPDGLPGSAVHVIGSGDIDLHKVKRDVLFVPELLPAPKLLRQMQTSHIHMAVVVDEYGSTLGVVTMEDVLEEIVGEIEDEFDSVAPVDFIKEGESFRVNGLFPLHALREQLPLDGVETGDADTIGGYIVQQLERLPRPGDTVQLGHYTVRVLTVQQKRAGQVLITPATQDVARADGAGSP